MRRTGFFSLLVGALLLALPVHAQTFNAGTSSPAQMEGFGQSVAVGAGHIFVGETQNRISSGMVYAYRTGDDGSWQEMQALSAPDGVPGDGFGNALVVDNTTLFVGAARQDSARGAVHIFSWDADAMTWNLSQSLADINQEKGDLLGSAIAVEGDLAVVGAPGNADRAGAATIYRRDADTGMWARSGVIRADGLAEGDRFGSSVALHDGHVVVAAPRKDNGVLYVFGYDEEVGSWTQRQMLTDNALEGARLGSAVLSTGTTLVAGAPRAFRGTGVAVMYSLTDDGRFERSGQVLPYDGDRRFGFGSTLAMGGDQLWVGAPGADGRRGTVYAFSMAESGMTAAQRLGIDGLEARDAFSGSIAAEDGLAVVGITGDDFGIGSVAVMEQDAETGAWTMTQQILGEQESLAAVYGEQINCTDGEAGRFDCNEVDLLSFSPITELGGARGVRLNDLWGWTDPETSREYAIVGRMDGTSFVDVTDPFNPVYLGNLPRTEGSPASVWRDIKVYADHAFIVADAANEHGMQVFDLTQLRDVTQGSPVTFEQTAHYDRIHSAHNIVINEDTGFAYAVGSSSGGETCGGGLHMIDIRDPQNPTFAGCFSDTSTGRASTGYSHDAQCIVYNGPDTEHQGKEICFGSNETALSIADVSDKENPVALSSAAYPNVSYTHQGWITDDHRFFYVNDELDELGGNTPNTRTLIWDVQDLDDPQLVKEFLHETTASDHNLYIDGQYMYQSNYATGLQVFDISDVENPVRVGHFDTQPFGDNGPGFSGSWSNYPYFQSGIVVVTSVDEGLFIVKKRDTDL